ncbi:MULTISPECIES: rhodanese-like domain-containing protein [unclassified Fusibacter]|uniref:rhodanese-like domain-containing protein n=1 Tax=unclassified Fusibacter TaxID=2624464 RepID=UPI001011190E|nr:MULTISPECIES: rhodanese-like domain-containing protein [unclassified Fusibacter]MCK8059086.1 rhodanese-like domain-containing protein [Fusibacter sp. A2]NPE22495.1 rhodanese-like domain-containing protein [Fusibacter sp. A1]RXV60599.1 rhodanese-like domain-containing protein [Fusibacter sp. A1]
MNYILILFVAVVVLYFLTKNNKSDVDQISSETLKDLLKEKNHQFIDVRTPSEFSASKIKGFKNIPLASLNSRKHEIKTDQPVVVICASGARSMSAASMLTKSGYKVINVKGGMSSYRA